MTTEEHRHHWHVDSTGVIGCRCGETMDDAEVGLRLNAVEALRSPTHQHRPGIGDALGDTTFLSCIDCGALLDYWVTG